MRLHKEEKAESVEAALPSRPATWLDRPTSTLHQTDLSKSVEVPFTPINIPLTVKVNTPHSICSSPLVKVLVYSSSAGEALLGVESNFLLEL
jgi:hypothetical protein